MRAFVLFSSFYVAAFFHPPAHTQSCGDVFFSLSPCFLCPHSLYLNFRQKFLNIFVISSVSNTISLLFFSPLGYCFVHFFQVSIFFSLLNSLVFIIVHACRPCHPLHAPLIIFFILVLCSRNDFIAK